ncbi:MAG: hypothetical protein KME25_23890 [Symplocastrum torsivum CPER-KK1]|jgi:chromosome segregation ATPase|uniref:Transposase n=1 Tax=Symplocastrum torsivum CPER-KK1 TaxID=450513 RepID=A0A951UBV3_9CYAN|nr:hypothetical protein [Symplocastrum torsivum CPER-KK1]
MSTIADAKQARIDNLTRVQAERKEQALAKVNQALERMSKQGKKINFQTIAQEANVSVSYLYKYPELKVRIAEIRNQQSVIPRPRQPEPASVKSHQVIVSRLKGRIQQLEKELTDLRKINEGLAGRVYRLTELEALCERQSKRIKDLEERLKVEPAPIPEDNPKVTPIDKGKTRGITDRIKDELDRLGIKLNSTLTRKIKAADEETVLNALSALEEAMGSGNVKNASGFLVRAITERWTKEDSPQQLPQRQPEIYTASPKPDEELVPLDQLKHLLGGTDE